MIPADDAGDGGEAGRGVSGRLIDGPIRPWRHVVVIFVILFVRTNPLLVPILAVLLLANMAHMVCYDPFERGPLLAAIDWWEAKEARLKAWRDAP